MGSKNAKTGAGADRLDLTDLYQVLAYVLFDRSDADAIRSLSIYSGKHGALVTWPLAESLETMAGSSVDVAAEREVI